MHESILIIEDDTTYALMLKGWFKRAGYEVVLHTTVEKARKELATSTFKLILSDLRLPDGDGIMLLSWIKEKKIQTPVIIMTSYGEVQSAVSAIKLGAFDYLEKPINPSILKVKIEEAFNYVPPVEEVVKKPTREQAMQGIIYGKSQASKQMYEHIDLVAPTHLSVLIMGESGTGKESSARMVHEHSKRKGAPFIAIDCGSLSKELAPSELFGHVKGAFTSAVADKKGVFEQAEGGTVFLDEVGNLSYDVQVQLLRAIQERIVRPVGASSDRKIDVRIIVATNENIQTAIQEGRFREDLYHRLNEFMLTIPPLRERGDDIILFSENFLMDASKELERHVEKFSAEALDVLTRYSWPGNLRELRNVIRRAVLFTTGNELTVESLPDYLFLKEEPTLLLTAVSEEEQIKHALEVAKGNKSKAAKLLNIDRKTLYNKMHQYGMKL